MKLPIVIVGFMASGKSSQGKKLARKLQLRFIDLDERMEEKEGLSVSQIFASKGEHYFRALEADTLKEVLQERETVIAVGGGAVCYANHMDLVNNAGTSLYFKKSNAQLLGRLRQNKANRPLVAHLNDEELQDFIQQKMEERTPFYEQAQVIWDKDLNRKEDWGCLLTRLEEANS